MSWASKRQFSYFSGLLIFIGIIVSIVIYPILTRKPSCTDKKQNGTERGVDCGGVCSLICPVDVVEPVVLWQRAFPITDHFYNLSAQIENRNSSGATRSASYVFKAYDKNNLLIGEREGSTYIPPNQPFLIFEPQFQVGQTPISRVLFEFTDKIVWENKKDTISSLPISVSNILFNYEDHSPSLSAHINNDSIYDLPDFDVVSLLYDTNHNVINVSRTSKEKLESSGDTNVYFTWPKAFSLTPVTYEVVLQINPFKVSF